MEGAELASTAQSEPRAGVGTRKSSDKDGSGVAVVSVAAAPALDCLPIEYRSTAAALAVMPPEARPRLVQWVKSHQWQPNAGSTLNPKP